MDTTSTGLRISDVADRTGFSGPTLRYYEQIGLLPPPERTDAGYRIYTDRDIDRLRFIARAKTLGCSLDEIGDLLTVWDEDRCGPVQHQLRSLVGAKLRESQARIAEQMAFTSELQAAAAQLADEPIDGACDDTCACASPTDVNQSSAQVGVALGERLPVDGPRIVCTLGGSDMSQRIGEWQDLLTHVTAREPLDGGVRLVLVSDAPLAEVVRLAAAEHDCCTFFSFAVTIDHRGAALEITAPPEGAEVLTAAFGSAA